MLIEKKEYSVLSVLSPADKYMAHPAVAKFRHITVVHKLV
jgi:hypothetical protein